MWDDTSRHAVDVDAVKIVDAGSVAPVYYEIPMPAVRADGPNFSRSFGGELLGRVLIWDPAGAWPQTQDLALLTMKTVTERFRASGVEAGFDRVDKVPGWRAGFWWALIGRDAEALRELVAYPVERLRASGGDAFDEFQYEWVRLLQQAGQFGPQGLADQARSIDTTSRVGAQDSVDLLLQPVIEVFARLAAEDEDGFNYELGNALRWHRAFFDRDPWRNDPEGVLSLPLLALACWAHDLGLNIEVESEYLPVTFIHHAQWRPALEAAKAQGEAAVAVQVNVQTSMTVEQSVTGVVTGSPKPE